MRGITPAEIAAQERIERIELQRRIVGNFALAFVCLFFFVTLTHTAALDAADIFVARNAKLSETAADFDMPLPAEKPPEGEGWLLNRSHLRWLCRESIRMEALKSGINYDNERAVKEYFAELQKFNSVAQNCFCEAADLKAAHRDVEPFREIIEEAARLEAEANGWGKWR